MAQICNHFSPFLSRVTDLGISSTRQTSGTDDVDRVQWAEIIRTFNCAGVFRAAGTLAAVILRTLSLAARDPNMLPALHTLHVPKLRPENHVAFEKAAESFATTRRLSGLPVEVYPPNLDAKREYSCEDCGVSFKQLQGLKRHHKDRHRSRNMCPHCGIFRWSAGRKYAFRAHLKREHPDVAHTNTLI